MTDFSKIRKEETVKEYLQLEIGYNLIKLVEKRKNAPLLQKIAEKRKSISIPIIRIVDNSRLESNEFRLTFSGEEVDRGIVTEENAVDVIMQAIINYDRKD
jgi:flagellar biosynthesis component FlhA